MWPAVIGGLLIALAVLSGAPAPGPRLPHLCGRSRMDVAARIGLRPGSRSRSVIARMASGVPEGLRRRPPGGLLSGVDVAALADQLALLAAAGLPAHRMWAAVADHGPTAPVRAAGRAVVAGQRSGSTAAAALRAHLAPAVSSRGSGGALRPGLPPGRGHHRSAAQLAVVVDLTEVTGAGTAQALQRFAAALRADQRAATERETALAGPRATATVLGLLPLAGLLLGAVVGGRPWHALLATGPGRLCLATGGLLWSAGRVWTRLLVARAAAAG